MICLIQNKKIKKQASCTDFCKRPVLGLENALREIWGSRIFCHIYLKVKDIW
jgi:hypothetical protein